LNPTDIESIELGLINKCVLDCRLCLRQEAITDNLEKDVAIDLGTLSKFMDQLPNLKQVDLVGSISEPTLHKQFYGIIKYIKGRNLKIRLSTNGNTFSLNWWANLGKLMDERDIVRFAVDGSTQEIHAKYRVNGKLSKVLACHTAFKSTSRSITVLQNILFAYNIDDQDNVRALFMKENFDICEFTHTGGFDFTGTPALIKDNILPVKDLLSSYNKLTRDHTVNMKLNCAAFMGKYVYLNHLGCVLPCDDMEETTFISPSNNITIYNNTIDECFAHVNSIISKRFFCNTCSECCGQLHHDIRKEYPIIQYNRNGDSESLYKFREVMNII
jgi:organic radical activating enzyme